MSKISHSNSFLKGFWFGAGVGALSLGHRPWKDMTINRWCHLPCHLEKACLYQERMKLTNKYMQIQKVRDKERKTESFDTWDPVMPEDGLDFLSTWVIKFHFYLSWFKLVWSLTTEKVLIKTDLYLIYTKLYSRRIKNKAIEGLCKIAVK